MMELVLACLRRYLENDDQVEVMTMLPKNDAKSRRPEAAFVFVCLFWLQQRIFGVLVPAAVAACAGSTLLLILLTSLLPLTMIYIMMIENYYFGRGYD